MWRMNNATSDANPDPGHFECHLTVEHSDANCIDLLANNTQLSKQKLKSALSKGAVWLESAIGIHRIRRAKKIIAQHDTLHLYYDETILNKTAPEAELIADEGEYSIWNKPYGMYSQGSKWGDHCTIYRWAEEHLLPQRPAFLVHRLDRAASGLIILAHSKKTATAFSTLFQQRRMQKQYTAIVTGELTQIELPKTITQSIDDKPAITKIISATSDAANQSTITIEIETGRKHQIRKHLAALGHPIIGDRLYGKPPFEKDLQLQATLLKFHCPITGEVKQYSL